MNDRLSKLRKKSALIEDAVGNYDYLAEVGELLDSVQISDKNRMAYTPIHNRCILINPDKTGIIDTKMTVA